MTQSTGRITARKEGALGWMIFDNPQRLNAVSLGMWQALPGVLADFDADPEIRVILLAGAGEQAFVSGADISEFEQQRGTASSVAAYNAAGDRANAALQSAAKPTIAVIRGFCIGGGLGIAIGCDLRISAADARFAVPAARLGLAYGFAGTRRLAGLVGPAFAKEIFFTARQFSAEEALRIGLVNRVVEAAALTTEAESLAHAIAANAPLTVATAKRAVDAAMADAAERDMAALEDAIERCFASEDYVEGRRAFLEKRRPQFRGR